MKIGYTTGVFDMFHVGHLNILREAKKHCEYLIVGVSTDELVQEYKHKVPIIPFVDRVEILESIKFVDKVVPQTDRDKIAAFYKYRFDCMFVGSDWKNTPLFDEVEAFLKKNGAEVFYIDYTQKVSSTILRTRLMEIS